MRDQHLCAPFDLWCLFTKPEVLRTHAWILNVIREDSKNWSLGAQWQEFCGQTPYHNDWPSKPPRQPVRIGLGQRPTEAHPNMMGLTATESPIIWN